MEHAPEWIVEGRAWVVGDNVNTESITPSKWMHAGHAEMLEHLGEYLIPEFPRQMTPGDVWVGGTNLGFSSSRNAPLYMKDKGIGAVVCNTAARIFYRNCVNMGLPIFELGPTAAGIAMGDRLRIDVTAARIENQTRGTEFRAEPFPDFIMELLLAGGIARYIAAHKERYALLA